MDGLVTIKSGSTVLVPIDGVNTECKVNEIGAKTEDDKINIVLVCEKQDESRCDPIEIMKIYDDETGEIFYESSPENRKYVKLDSSTTAELDGNYHFIFNPNSKSWEIL